MLAGLSADSTTLLDTMGMLQRLTFTALRKMPNDMLQQPACSTHDAPLPSTQPLYGVSQNFLEDVPQSDPGSRHSDFLHIFINSLHCDCLQLVLL